MALESPAGGWQPLLRSARGALAGNLVAHGLEATGSLADGERFGGLLADLSAYLDLVVSWNRRVDLTAARSAEELVDLTLADAAVLASVTAEQEGTRWVDVGSGAGAPGLVIAMLRTADRMTLVEPKEKRVAFLRSVIGELGMTGVVVRRGRSNLLPDDWADVGVSRATLPPGDWLQEGARLARRVWVLLARGEPPAPRGFRVIRDVRYTWPLTGVARRAVCYEGR